MKAFVASVVALAASTGASPAADPQLLINTYAGAAAVPSVAVGVVPQVALKDSGLVHHADSGAITPDFTDAQKEANPEIAAKAMKIKKYALTGKLAAVPAVHGVGVAGVPALGYGLGVHAFGKREAEADPALIYTNGAVVSHSGLVAHPDGAVTPDYTPAQKVAAANHFAAKGAYAAVVPAAIGYGYGHGLVALGKREAEADSDAYLAYSGVAGYPYVPTLAYSGYGLGYYGKRSADAEAKPYYYGGYGLPATTLGYGVPAVYSHWGKRSAEADAEAKPYYGLYGGYGLPATTLGYGVPAVYSHWGKRSAEADAEAKPYYGLYGAYGAYGYPAVHSAYGLGYYGKRDADAEAKPYYYGGYGLPATTLGYGVPAVYSHWGKRSADAEAKPYWGAYGGYGLPAYGGYAYPGYYY